MVVCLVYVCGLTFAQIDTDEPTTGTQSEEADLSASPYLILGEFGVGGGWPGYQLYHVNIAFQRETLGVIFRGSWTGVGPYLSLAGRYYTPIPVPVPTFVSLGAGVFSDNPSVFATVGAHVPFGLQSNFRATLELGGAFTTVLDQWQFLPTASIGIGYTFFIDQAPLTQEEREQREREREARRSGCTDPTDPDTSTLGRTFSNALDRELSEAQAAYAGVYRLLGRSYQITERENQGDRVIWRGNWEAEIQEVLTGNVESANGSFQVTFSWNGCGWGTSYSLSD